MMIALTLAFLIQILQQVHTLNFIRPQYELKTSQFKCLNTAGFNRVALRVDYNTFEVYHTDYQNWQNALNAGLKIQVTISPWTTNPRSVEDELWFMQKNNFDFNHSRYWIGLNYMYPHENSCQFLVQLTRRMKEMFHVQVGIKVDKKGWQYYFGSPNACLELSDTNSLWWQTEELDGQPNFDSFEPFAHWKIPIAKLYRDIKVCGINATEGYYE